MPRRPNPELTTLDDPTLWNRLTREPADVAALDDYVEIAALLRSRHAEWAGKIDRWFLSRTHRLESGLMEARKHLEDLEKLLDEYSAPPWHPAVHLGVINTERGPSACVSRDGHISIVSIGDAIDPITLRVGEHLLLSRDNNRVMARAPLPMLTTGETAHFERFLPDGRLVVKHRDEELVVRAAGVLDLSALRPGEVVRCDRALGLAWEPVPRVRDSAFCLDEIPDHGFEAIGGLDVQIGRLQRMLLLSLRHGDVARRYRMRRAGSVLLVGPPGTGKTMIARALANWLARQSKTGRVRYLSIKPSALHSMWYSQSEANYREVFRVAREQSEADPDTPVVMFFDEVDSIGAARTSGPMRVDERVLTSFMAELDGLEARGNVFVVAATNRRDALDPGLIRPGRLGDLVLDIPRPSMTAAAAILDKHFPSDIPYAGDEVDGGATRQLIVSSAVSRLYAPNGEGDIATITFRDNSRRTIAACEIVSGASLGNIARAAIEAACHREVETGEPGVRLSDVLDAVVEEVESAVSVLTPANCHTFVAGLPQDLGVARVEPRSRTGRRHHRFVSAA